MGDPKKRRKQFSVPLKKWEESRIKSEGELTREFGLKNKKEIWKADSKLRNFKRQAKRLVALNTEQAQKEKLQLLDRLKSLSLIDSNASIDNILDLTIRDLLNRRLQTVLVKKGIARSIKGSRQSIIHGHVTVNNTKLTVPSYLVKKNEEATLSFSVNSPFFSTEHPERVKGEKKPKKPRKEAPYKRRGRR